MTDPPLLWKELRPSWLGGTDPEAESPRAGGAALLIFLAPPSQEELERRLRERGTENDAQRARRMAAVEEELRQASWFDHRVVNDDADRAADEVAAIIDANRAGP